MTATKNSFPATLFWTFLITTMVGLTRVWAAAPQISSIQSSVKDTSATVTWMTDVLSDSLLQYDPSNNPPAAGSPEVASANLTTAHSFTLTNLTPGHEYFFNVTSCVDSQNCSTVSGEAFRTLPVPGSWKKVNSPSVTPIANISYTDNTLRATQVISANDIWTVGWSTNPNGPQFAEQTLIEHWDGASWQIVPSPNTTLPVNELYAVSAVSPTDIWAVGRAFDPSTVPTKTLSMHWDGASWTIVPSPSADTSGNELYGVTAVSANDVWAVGWHLAVPTTTTTTIPGCKPRKKSGGCTTTTTTSPLAETLVLHWNGTSWQQVSSPNPDLANGFNNELFAVSAIAGAANDIWAVGFSGNKGTFYQPLALHWDGASWSVSPVPNASSNVIGSSFVSVSGTGSQDVWAVGGSDFSTGFGTDTNSFMAHWNGQQWTPVVNRTSLVIHASTFVILNGVKALAPNFVWAVGEDDGNPFILQWSGSDYANDFWHQVPAADNAGDANPLSAVGATDTNNAWAVGFVGSGTALGTETLIEEYSIP